MKKKLFILAVLAVILAGAAAGTLAYFTASRVTHNVITSGNIDIELVETKDDGKGGEETYPTDPVQGIVPGDSVSKIVRVHNVGDHPAWVRIKVTVEVEDESGNALDAEKLRIDFNTQASDDWKYEDGYYFYKKVLASGARTEQPLFETVTFNAAMDNAYQNANIVISVQAQGVQAENNPIPADIENADVTDVKGWPKTLLFG